MDYEQAPPAAIAAHMDAVPQYGQYSQYFWYDWGPVFYRGRLDGSARVLCVASDPGETECLIRRTLIGDAGQRVQGFLTKLGLTQSYVCVNAYAYALHPTKSQQAQPLLSDPVHLAWRHKLFNLVTGPNLQAVIGFGAQAQAALATWPKLGNYHYEKIPHPSSRNPVKLLTDWNAAIATLRGLVTPDAGGSNTGPNYGATFLEADYAAIPRGDLPFGTATWIGDDSWGRNANPRHNNCVRRPDSQQEKHLQSDRFLIWERR